mgnify:CR=1 FL=1
MKKAPVPKMTMGLAIRFINAQMKKNLGSKTKPSAGAIKMAKGILAAAGEMKMYGSATKPKMRYGSMTPKKRKKKK